jgi:hypothetical protein
MKKLVYSGLIASGSFHHSSACLTHIVKCWHNHIVEVLFQELDSTQNILVLFQEVSSNRGYLCNDLRFIVSVEHLLKFKLLLKENFELLLNDLALCDTRCHIKQLVINSLYLLIDIRVKHLLVLCHLDLTL